MLRRLGINLLYLVPGHVGGTEIAARRMIAAVAVERPELEIVVFCGREAGAVLPDPAWPGNVRVVTLPVSAAQKPMRIAAELGLLPAAAHRHRVDLLHSYGTTAPPHVGLPTVVTVHDLIDRHWPEAFPLPARLGLRLLVPVGVRRSDRVQVASAAVREDLITTLGTPRDKIDLVPLGPGMRSDAAPTPEASLRRHLELGDAPVLLSIAAALPHKNLHRLLEAFSRLRAEPRPLLVLTGHAGRISDQLRAAAGELGIADRVRMTGWLDDEDVEGLYRIAAVFAYPSLHEGFGLPILEAMRRGVPVVSSDATSLPEVAGDGALLVDARSVAALAESLDRVLSDDQLRGELIARGQARADQFSWDRTARAALESYDRTLGLDARTP